MLVDYKTLTKTSKVYIYPSNRKFYKTELPVLKDLTEKFLSDFNGVDSFFDIKYDRFIVIIISDRTVLSLDQNDSLVGFIQNLEKEFRINLLDKINVCFKQGEYVQLKEVPDFKKLIKNRGVSKKTIILNNFVNTKDEFEHAWELPAENSWISHYF
jgi:hypothetical protein